MKAEVGRNPIFWIVLTAPLALLLLCQLQPTFDDWTYYTIPQMEPLTLHSLLPDGNYWRPFDVLFGYLLGLNYRLFPFLNHLFILLGHILNTRQAQRRCLITSLKRSFPMLHTMKGGKTNQM